MNRHYFQADALEAAAFLGDFLMIPIRPASTSNKVNKMPKRLMEMRIPAPLTSMGHPSSLDLNLTIIEPTMEIAANTKAKMPSVLMVLVPFTASSTEPKNSAKNAPLPPMRPNTNSEQR